jgi:hypothetical protein
MTYQIISSRYLRAFFSASIFAIAYGVSLHGQSRESVGSDLNVYFSSVNGVTDSTLAMVPATLETRANLDEKSILSVACVYDSNEFGANENLLNILKKSNFIESSTPKNKLLIRNAIFVRTKAGNLKIIFDEGGSDGLIHAVIYRNDSFSPTYAVTTSNLIGSLKEWASKGAVLRDSKSECIN